jgi:hypothetical protein
MTAGVPSEESLPLSAETRIDAVCLRFEAAWKAGEGGSARPSGAAAGHPSDGSCSGYRQICGIEYLKIGGPCIESPSKSSG